LCRTSFKYFLHFRFFSASEKEAILRHFESVQGGCWKLLKCPVQEEVLRCLAETNLKHLPWLPVKHFVWSKIQTKIKKGERRFDLANAAKRKARSGKGTQ
jgi:hypothetical protein